MHSGAFLTPVNSARELGPSTRVVETGLYFVCLSWSDIMTNVTIFCKSRCHTFTQSPRNYTAADSTNIRFHFSIVVAGLQSRSVPSGLGPKYSGASCRSEFFCCRIRDVEASVCLKNATLKQLRSLCHWCWTQWWQRLQACVVTWRAFEHQIWLRLINGNTGLCCLLRLGNSIMIVLTDLHKF